jgi:hypothetical protein
MCNLKQLKKGGSKPREWTEGRSPGDFNPPAMRPDRAVNLCRHGGHGDRQGDRDRDCHTGVTSFKFRVHFEALSLRAAAGQQSD